MQYIALVDVWELSADVKYCLFWKLIFVSLTTLVVYSTLTHSLTDHSHKARDQIKQCIAIILQHKDKLTDGMCVHPLCLAFSIISSSSETILRC